MTISFFFNRMGWLFFLLLFQFGVCQSINGIPYLHSIIHQGTSISKQPLPGFVKQFNKSNGIPILSKSSLQSLTIHADFTIAFGYVYNENDQDTLVIVNDTTFTLLLPEGQYGLISGYFPDNSSAVLFSMDSIFLIHPTEIHLFDSQATHQNQYQFVRETNDPLYVSTLTFYFYSRLRESGLQVANFGVGTGPFILRYQEIPSHFETEWAAKGKQGVNDGNVYLVSGELRNSQNDTLITNDPANLMGADFYYHFPDSVEDRGIVSILTLFPDFNLWGNGDIQYIPPVHLRIYQDISATFSLQSSTFKQVADASNLAYCGYIFTQEIRILENKVLGYFYFDRDAISFTLSETIEHTHIGLPPTYWFGKFFNTDDSIRIGSPYGRWKQLFLSQSNDILRHYDVDYKIFHNGELIKQGNFPPYSSCPIMFLGFNPDSLKIPIPTGSYTMQITDNHYQLAGAPGMSRVIAGFNLTKADKNPPNLISFQILANNELANVLTATSANKIRFIAEEETELSSIELYYRVVNDSLWNPIPVAYQTPYWQGYLPALAVGEYSLRLMLTDTSQNYIDCLMAPAFIMDNTNDINVPLTKDDMIHQKLYLSPAYPNPFNSSTQVSFYLPKRTNVTLTIYDITGKEVIRLIDNRFFVPGKHEILWNGVNQAGKEVSSGIYLYELKAGDFKQVKKMLLIQ